MFTIYMYQDKYRIVGLLLIPSPADKRVLVLLIQYFSLEISSYGVKKVN